MSEKSPLDRHTERIEEFAESQLRTYIEQVRDGRVGESKEFNDPIWGTIRLHPLEVTILDSPLLQRLRRIRQLGVVHLIYMAATHTRLEHSVGVVHQVQRITDSINTRGLVGSSKDGQRVLPDTLVETLRLAGLCHDIGHGAMSHVSEYALDDNRECRSVMSEFADVVDVAHESQLSEIAAYLTLGSKAFKELLKVTREQLGLPPAPDQAGLLQKLIVGARIDAEVVLAQEMISGPFDADKLDYLARDATMCGVPIVSDVTRLIQKVRAARADPTDLPQPLQTRLQERRGGYVITGLARSGGSTLMELALARVLMFDKVYRHHAVRAAEAMVFEIVGRLAVLSPHPPALVPLLLTDEQLLDLDVAAISRFIQRDPSELNKELQQEVATIADLADRLRSRRLFVRGFAIAGTMTSDAYRDDPDHVLGLRLFLQELGKSGTRRKIKARICDRVRKILSLLGLAELERDFGPHLEAYVHLSPPKPAPKTLGTDTDHAFLIDEDGQLTSFNDEAPETAGWSDAYIATHDLGHVFCPKELAPYVFIASETDVREQHNIHLPQSMLPYTKLRSPALDELRRELLAVGYYEGLPTDLRPAPAAFSSAGFDSKVESAVKKIDGYAGPVLQAGNRLSAAPLAAARVRNFIKQFGDDEFIHMALEAVSATRQITRNDIRETLEAFLAKYPEFETASLCALGSVKDSSTIYTNLAADAGDSHSVRPRSLKDALKDENPIIFIDDFVGRGSQTKDILQHWLELPPTQKLNEEREVLPVEDQERLLTKKLAFVYVAGLDGGAPEVKDFADSAGVDAEVYVHIPQSDLPTLASVFGSHPRLAEFREFCAAVGMKVLENHHGKPRDEEWRRGRVLGYGGHELLFTSMFNTPTATLTALWAGGDTSEWQPIFPRRSKN